MEDIKTELILENKIVDKLVPDEQNRSNTNKIFPMEHHLYSTIYRLTHTQIAGIGDYRVLYYEQGAGNYIEDEGGIKLAVE